VLYSFENYTLDTQRRELRRGSNLIAVQPQVFDLLAYLIHHRERVVSKDDLIADIWGGRVVSESSLTTRINAARIALGDNGDVQRLIRTVARKGVRFVGPVVEHELADRTSVRFETAAPEGQREPAERPSIAVLPFQNMSGNPEQEYFADGMVEEIITGLSRIKWLSVISRNSTFIYKNKPVVVKEVADKFGVRYVLEGGVRKSGNRVRITAQLIDGNTDAHLWAQHYDRVVEDVFALQDEITMCVVGAIEPSLWKAEIDRIKRQRPTSLNAYDLVLRSLPFVLGHIPEDSEAAVPLLEEALRLQPDYATAHAFLARCFHHRYARAGLREEDRLAAVRHSRAAVGHGSDDATALATAAHIIAFDEHDTATALKLFDRALELSNSNVFALSFSAIILAWMGKAELAVERAERALRLSPFDFYNFRAYHALAIVWFCSGRYAEAVDAARSAVHANPRFSVAHAVLGAALLRAGRSAEAQATARDVLQHESTFTIRGVWRVSGKLEPTVFRPLSDAWREIGLPE